MDFTVTSILEYIEDTRGSGRSPCIYRNKLDYNSKYKKQ